MPSFISTRDFGAVPYDASAALHFPLGLPGFEHEKTFVSLQHPNYGALVFLQSIATQELCFVALPVQMVAPGYSLTLSEEDVSALGFAPGSQPVPGKEILCLVLLSLLPEQPPTANLLAPVVIRLATQVGVQAIQGSGEYSHAHPMLAAEPVCS